MDATPNAPPDGAAVARAHALLEQGRYDEAEALLRASALAAPGHVASGRLLGKLLLQRGAWEAAAPWLGAAAAAAPPDDAVAFDLAWCLFKLDRPAEAAALLEPLRGRPDAAHLLGRAWLEAGRAEDARPVLAGCGLPAADLDLGWCHFVAGRPDEAAACWERWMRAGAADWGTKDTLATFLFLVGGGARPSGRPERPAEPLRDLDRWIGLLARYRLVDEIVAAIERGPALDPAMWQALRPMWGATLRREGLADLGARLLAERP
jgi:tetratricopeptide (TPR) repeat protein